MPLVRAGDDVLNVREWGERGAPHVLAWHALGPVASAGTLGEAATALAARGRHVAGIDGPGFGASPALPLERYDNDELARLALGVADGLGLARFAVLGHSWGGAVVLAVAEQAPERVEAVVLLDSGHIDYATLPGVDTSLPSGDPGETPSWESEAAFEADLRSETERFTPELLAGYLAGTRREGKRLVGVEAATTAAARWGLANARVPARWPAVAANGIPVLLLLATKHPHVDQNREHLPAFERAVPHAEVRWVPEAGHDLLADAAPALGREIADWLGRL